MYDYLTELVDYQKCKGSNVNLWVTPQFVVPACKNTLSNETKSSDCQVRMKPFWNYLLILSNETFWSRVSKAFGGLIKTIPVCFPFSAALKTMTVNRDEPVSVEWFPLKSDW